MSVTYAAGKHIHVDIVLSHLSARYPLLYRTFYNYCWYFFLCRICNAVFGYGIAFI